MGKYYPVVALEFCSRRESKVPYYDCSTFPEFPALSKYLNIYSSIRETVIMMVDILV